MAASLAAIGPLGELTLLTLDGDTVAASPLAHPEQPPTLPLSRSPATFAWPTWTADGAALLVSTVEVPSQGTPPALLLRYPLAGEPPAILYTNPDATALLGPRMPHYVNPSPDARHVALLTPTPPAGLSLLFLDAAGRGPAQAAARGSPLFSAWAPRSDALLLHIGGELSLLELASAPATAVFASNHTGYRVPAWSADGASFAVSAPEGGQYTLQLFDRAGKRLGSLAPSASTAAFAWSADGERLALARLVRSDGLRYTDLQIVPLAGGAPRPARCGPCLAFIWSPDGAYLAVLLPAPRDGHASWLALDRDGEVVRRFPTFEPSPEFSIYAAFFDQYALSHRLWSADSSRLLAFGRMQLNGKPPELLPSTIYVHDVPGGDVRAIAQGSVAFWSPQRGS